MLSASLALIKSQESNQADSGQADGIADIVEDFEETHGPPDGSVARRAKSYSDFYDAARAQLKKHAKDRDNVAVATTATNDIKTDLEFRHWYNGIEEQLLEAGNEPYQ